ncbi:MAG TPA: glycosyltransferase, partial [Desulfobacterales bacterium]|nr:glycosyltransferase [Desulfobacterales bacterium]
PCSWFDPTFYRSHYLESNSIPIAPLDHYLAKGVHEGLYPNKAVADLPDKPIISLLVPVYNVTPAHLNNCIRSVLYQSYPHWELCLADDCSTREEVRPLLEQWASQDSRIKVTFLEKNLGISGATNVAAELVTGSYVGFLDNDDELTNDCLFRVVQQINSTKADLYYSDEDLIGDDGRQFNIFHKPDFNKELLLSHNYVTHFVVADKMLYENGGGFDSFLDGAQDFDLFLKLSEQAKKIVHIPQILYHWRASESSTSINHNQKQYANEAGRKAVANALDRRGVDAEVELLEWKFYYRVTRKLSFLPHISICILYREDDNFQQNLASLVSSTVYPDVEFLIIKEETQQLLLSDLLNSDLSKKVRLLSVSGKHTPAGLYNEAVDQSRGRYTVFLNSNVQLQQEKWIQALLEYVLNENVGMVGGRILPFKQNEFVTTIPNMENQSSFYYARYLQECSRHMNGLQWPQNVFAVSWNLAMVEKKYFLEMGGFNDESFGYLFADSDLCFRMQEQGREIFYTPFALGQYLIPEEEQFSSQLEQTGLEKKLFQNRWQDKLSLGDPYYNLNVLKRKNVTETDFLNWYVGEQAE